MKNLIKMGMISLLLLGLAGCGSGDSKPKEKVFLKEEQMSDLYTTPDDYIGKYVTIIGEVVSTPKTKIDDMSLFQMWGDITNSDNINMVKYNKADHPALKSEDYVKLTGYVEGTYEGENLLGNKLKAPQLIAEKIEVLSYMDAVVPTLKSVNVNQTKESNGVKITLNKIEFAKDETRVYVSIDNQSKYQYNFYSFNCKITQNNKQYSEESNYKANYKELDSDILSGIKEEGVITFKGMKQEDLKFICEGNSENYDFDRDNFTFDIKVK